MLILFIDDNPADFELARISLKMIPELDFVYVKDFENFKANFVPNKYDAILSDYNLIGALGTDILDYVKRLEPEIPFIIISGALGEELAVDILRQGATDYVLKDNINKLPLALLRALKESKAAKDEKLMLQKLKESEEKYRIVVEDQIEYIVRWKPDGEILFANNSFAKLYYIESQNIVHHNFFDLIPSYQKDIVLKKVSLLSIQNPTISDVHKSIDIEKGEVWNEWTDRAFFNLDGTVREYQSIGRNITEKKQNELEREKLLKEFSNKCNELMQFNYIVSHNLRAPVAKILGLRNMINLSNSQEEKTEIIEHIYTTTQQLDELIQDLNLTLTSRTPLNERKEAVSVSSVIARVSDFLEVQIQESQAIIKTHISAKSDEIITIKSYLESILYNLISNAIKYRRISNPIEIDIYVDSIKSNIIIKVEDNGQGIDLEKHGQYIFGLYKRFAFEVEGKGLGLHMTKNQIEALGGTISVASERDKGTAFTIILPNNK